jgi:CBS domain-containing protein
MDFGFGWMLSSVEKLRHAPIHNLQQNVYESVCLWRDHQVLISEILNAKHSYRWVNPVISKTATVKEAIAATIDGGLSGMMVLDGETSRRVVGLITSRDLLRIMALGIKDNESSDAVLDRVIGDYMTPISQVIYGRPEETVGMCRTIMAKLGIKCLPILSRQGTVEGLITARDMSDFGLSAKDKGGKQSYLNDVSQRVGLSSNTSMAEPPLFLRAHLALEQNPLFVNVGVCALPHPFKTARGEVGRNQRGSLPYFVCVCEDRRKILFLATICLNPLLIRIFDRHSTSRVRIRP